MASLTDLPAVLERALSLFTSQLESQGVAIPDRSYVQPGSIPVWDGEQLTVGLMGLAPGQPGIEIRTTYPPLTANYTAKLFVLLIRAISIIDVEGTAEVEIPTAEESDADGQALAADAGALLRAADAIHALSIAPGAQGLTGSGEGFVIDDVQPLGPEGALAANRLLLSISLS